MGRFPIPIHYLGLLSVVSHYLFLSVRGFQVKIIIFISIMIWHRKTHLEQSLHSGFLHKLAAFTKWRLRLFPWPFTPGVGYQKKSECLGAGSGKIKLAALLSLTKGSPCIEGSLTANREIFWGVYSSSSPCKSPRWGPASLVNWTASWEAADTAWSHIYSPHCPLHHVIHALRACPRQARAINTSSLATGLYCRDSGGKEKEMLPGISWPLPALQ